MNLELRKSLTYYPEYFVRDDGDEEQTAGKVATICETQRMTSLAKARETRARFVFRKIS